MGGRRQCFSTGISVGASTLSNTNPSTSVLGLAAPVCHVRRAQDIALPGTPSWQVSSGKALFAEAFGSSAGLCSIMAVSPRVPIEHRAQTGGLGLLCNGTGH